MGTLFKRGETWYLQYGQDGRQVRRSAKTTVKAEADAMLKRIEAEVVDGIDPSYRFSKVTLEDLVEEIKTDYRINRRKSTERLGTHLRHMRRFFGNCKPASITTKRLREYRDRREGEGASPSTVNRELSTLRKMFNLGATRTPPLVRHVPKFPIVKEDNTRTGFFEHDEFLRLREHLPVHLQGPVTLAYKRGLRRGEILNLTWDQVERRKGEPWVLHLDPSKTKNNSPRTVLLDVELTAILREAFSSRRVDCPNVFIAEGRQIGLFRKSWLSACRDAGIPGRLFHDLRRTAARNMVRTGTPESVVMKIAGWKTRSVFLRYDIASEEDQLQAAQRLDEYLDTQGSL